MKFVRLAGALLALWPLCLCGEIPPAFDAADQRAVELGLRAIKMTERDLGFSKTNVETELLLPQARNFLQHPLQLPLEAGDVMSRLTGATNLPALVAAVCPSNKQIELPATRYGTTLTNTLVLQILSAIEAVQALLPKPDKPAFEAAFIEMLNDNADKRELAGTLFARTESLELQDCEVADALLNASDHFDREGLNAALALLVRAINDAIPKLQAIRSDFQQPSQIEYDLPLGKVIIGGAGPNTYTNDAVLIVDFGGDDVYLNSAGGANGLTGQPVSIVIDLAGNDQFISKRNFSQGSGVFGIGILAALGSNCTFQAKHFSQGAGFFGCGILMTGEGKQTFEADTFCQGAGMFGTGILWQRGDDTTYTANKYAQGFGGVQGCGLLLDAAGNDTYVAGGKEACGWLAGHYFSLSQGFGYGMRPFAAGGIGILCDLKGDDHYKADVYGQGASYWYSVGLLLDAEGNDTYEAHQYCQGAGIHLSSGALIDWAGNDTYIAGHICQGAAHDYSVGMLIDRAGDDKYTGDTTAQGAAINNSFAMLLDHAGDDTYTGTDPKQSQASGHDGDKREYGSIGLLLDLGGTDKYSQGQSNNAVWLKPLYGAGLDFESPTNNVATLLRSAEAIQSINAAVGGGNRLYTIALVDPQHPIEHLFRVATSARPEAGKAWDELKQHAAENLPYLITRLASPNVMVRVKFEELVDHLNTNSIPLLIAGIRTTKDDEVARLCCYFLARFNEKARAGIPAVLPLLKRPITRPVAFYTLGHMRAAEAFGPAMDAVDESRELVRLRATQALGKIGNKRAIPRLIHKLDDEIYDVRYAAEDGLVAFGKPTLGALWSAYEKATSRARPHILEALAKLGDERALSFAEQFYRNDEPIVRDAVLKSLTDALTQARSPAPPTAKADAK